MCKRIKAKQIEEHIFELPTFTKINYRKGLKLDKEMFQPFGCSAVSKIIDGDMYIARSYDLNMSNKAAYIIRTAVEGYNKTVGISYAPFYGDDADVVLRKGVKKKDALRSIFFTTDILNDKGLYIEGNMRPQQLESTGIKDTAGTAPECKVKLSVGALIRFLAERCDTVDQCLALADNLNITGFAHGNLRWGAGLYLADKTGNYGVLEICDNELIWNEHAHCQTNFYINPKYAEKATIGLGWGRYKVLAQGIYTVHSKKDMLRLIDKVSYTRSWLPYSCPFDVRGELPGIDKETYKDFGGCLTTEMAFDEKNKEKLMTELSRVGEENRNKPLQQLRNEGQAWHSAYQTVVNCNKGTIDVRFFENNKLRYTLEINEDAS